MNELLASIVEDHGGLDRWRRFNRVGATIVTGGAFLILIASYHLLVRHSWLGRWLNGRKLPWRKPVATGEMQTA